MLSMGKCLVQVKFCLTNYLFLHNLQLAQICDLSCLLGLESSKNVLISYFKLPDLLFVALIDSLFILIELHVRFSTIFLA